MTDPSYISPLSRAQPEHKPLGIQETLGTYGITVQKFAPVQMGKPMVYSNNSMLRQLLKVPATGHRPLFHSELKTMGLKWSEAGVKPRKLQL